MTKIKICGLQRKEDISYVNELKPDYIGFVFLQGRRRYISPKDAASLRALLNPFIQSVGVFVDEPVENVVSLYKIKPYRLLSFMDRKMPLTHKN